MDLHIFIYNQCITYGKIRISTPLSTFSSDGGVSSRATSASLHKVPLLPRAPASFGFCGRTSKSTGDSIPLVLCLRFREKKMRWHHSRTALTPANPSCNQRLSPITARQKTDHHAPVFLLPNCPGNGLFCAGLWHWALKSRKIVLVRHGDATPDDRMASRFSAERHWTLT